MIGTIYLGTVVLSAIVQGLNNKSASDTIKRQGFDIDNSKTTGTEKFNYFLTDYFFLLIPIYNLCKSIIKNKIKTKPHEYAEIRKETFSNRGMLVSKAEKEARERALVKEIKKEEKEQTDLPPRRTQSVEREEQKSLPPRKKSGVSNKFSSKEDELAYYKAERRKLALEYKNSVGKPYSVRLAMYDKIMNYDEHIKSLKAYIAKNQALEAMKREMAELELSLENEKKLELE